MAPGCVRVDWTKKKFKNSWRGVWAGFLSLTSYVIFGTAHSWPIQQPEFGLSGLACHAKPKSVEFFCCIGEEHPLSEPPRTAQCFSSGSVGAAAWRRRSAAQCDTQQRRRRGARDTARTPRRSGARTRARLIWPSNEVNRVVKRGVMVRWEIGDDGQRRLLCAARYHVPGDVTPGDFVWLVV